MRRVFFVPLLALPVFSFADKIDDLVNGELARQRIPGCSIAIVKDGKPLRLAGYGFANLEHKVPATSDTIYQSGSVGKQFTSALVLKLVEQGKISLDDSIVKYFPEAKGKWDDVRIRHLLGHLSGLPDMPYSTMSMRRDYTEDELVKLMLSQKIVEKPGEKWRYNNGGYVMLGVLVGRVGKKFYGEQLVDQVFKPLGMNTARIISERDIVLNRAAGYEMEGENWKNQTWVAPRLNTTADGSLYLSVRDMAKWEAALDGKALLKPSSWDLAWTPGKTNDGKSTAYGFGWAIGRDGKHRIIAHNGAWQGFTTCIMRVADQRLTVIVLTNLTASRSSPDTIAAKILHEYVSDLTVPKD